jgi:hypothetical protein
VRVLGIEGQRLAVVPLGAIDVAREAREIARKHLREVTFVSRVRGVRDHRVEPRRRS